ADATEQRRRAKGSREQCDVLQAEAQIVEQGFREQRSVRLAEGRDRADELRSVHRNDGGDRAGDDGQEDRRYSGTEGSAPGAGECDLGPERSGEREQQAGGTGELLGETECVRGGECAEEEAIDAERHS